MSEEFDIGAAVEQTAESMGLFGKEADDATDPVEKPDTQNEPGEQPDRVIPPEQKTDQQTNQSSAPKTWRTEAASLWENLPEVARKEILKRESDIFRGIETYKTQADKYNEVDRHIGRHIERFRSAGQDPYTALDGLLSAHEQLQTGSIEQKREILIRAAREFGVQIGGDDFQQPYIDPHLSQMQGEIAQLRSMLAADQQTKQRAAYQSSLSEVEAFSSDPSNEYFNEVSASMSNLIEKGVCSTLKEAYDQAVWIDPVVRAKQLLKQSSSFNDKHDQARASRKAASVNLTVGAKTGGAAAPLDTIEETLSRRYDELMGR